LSVRLALKEVAVAYLSAMLLASLLIAADRIGVWGAGRIPYSNRDGCDIWFYFSLIIASRYFWRIKGKEPGVQITIGRVPSS
jgi:hypothetical protein